MIEEEKKRNERVIVKREEEKTMGRPKWPSLNITKGLGNKEFRSSCLLT
jgi:hypothetical protein